MIPIDGMFCPGCVRYKQTRDAFQQSCLTGPRLWALITLQTLWWVRDRKSWKY